MRGFGFPDTVIRGDREFPRATVLFLGGRRTDKLQRRVSTENFSKHQLITVGSTRSLPPEGRLAGHTCTTIKTIPNIHHFLLGKEVDLEKLGGDYLDYKNIL